MKPALVLVVGSLLLGVSSPAGADAPAAPPSDSGASAPTPTPPGPRRDPCASAAQGSGEYCGGSLVGGDPGLLYRCHQQATVSTIRCETPCEPGARPAAAECREAEPPPRNPALRTAGLVMMGVGVASMIAGGIMTSAKGSSHSPSPVALAGLLGGIVGGLGVFLIPGAIMTAVGSSPAPKKTVSRLPTWLPPAIAVGPASGHVTLRWAF